MCRTAQEAGLDQQAIFQLKLVYAKLLVEHALGCWIKQIAAFAILQEKLTHPGQDIWLYLRNEIIQMPQAFRRLMQLSKAQAEEHMVSLAAVDLRSIFCSMLESREPWKVLYERSAISNVFADDSKFRVSFRMTSTMQM